VVQDDVKAEAARKKAEPDAEDDEMMR